MIITNSNFIDILKYMKVPLLVGLLLSISAALLGIILVVKKYSMIGDGLSHVGFGSVAIALALGQTPLLVSIPVVMLAAYILLRLGENKKVNGDAAIALISSSALAIGYLVGNLTNGFSTDINSYMFGSITTATVKDLYYILPITICIIVMYIFMYNRIFAVTFDESFAKATGMNTRLYSIIFALGTAMVVVIGIKVMGTLLISSLIIFPALSSKRMFTNFKRVVISSVVVACVAFTTAFFFFSEFSSAASIVVVNLVIYIISVIVYLIKKRFRK